MAGQWAGTPGEDMDLWRENPPPGPQYGHGGQAGQAGPQGRYPVPGPRYAEPDYRDDRYQDQYQDDRYQEEPYEAPEETEYEEQDADVPRARARRSPAPSAPERRGHGGQATMLLLGLPLLGAFIDEAIGSGVGTVFAICTVLAAAGAIALSSRSGWWWLMSAIPPIVLAETAMAEMLANSAQYSGTKALATGLAKWAINGFPVMAGALGVGIVVMIIRIVREKKQQKKGNRRG